MEPQPKPPPLEYQPPAATADESRAANRALLTRVLRTAGITLLMLALAGAALKAGLGVYRKVEITREAERARRAYRSESVALLAAAKTPADLENAVDPDGVILHTRDGAWVAVRYGIGGGDERGASLVAVARDSGGRWFESDRPFGLNLARYRTWQGPRARAKESHDPDWDEKAFLSMGLNRPLDEVEQSADLARARDILKRALGFHEFKP